MVLQYILCSALAVIAAAQSGKLSADVPTGLCSGPCPAQSEGALVFVQRSASMLPSAGAPTVDVTNEAEGQQKPEMAMKGLVNKEFEGKRIASKLVEDLRNGEASRTPNCESWCPGSWGNENVPWTTKCKFEGSCDGCSCCESNCDAEQCESWCDSSTSSWHKKCTFVENCGGCSPCVGLPPFNYLIADRSNQRIQRCTFGGDCVTVLGKFGKGDVPDGKKTVGDVVNYVSIPKGATFTSNGDIAIADTNSNRILLCLASGTGDCTIVADYASGGINGPMDVKFTSDGDYVVTCSASHSVLKCAANGTGSCTTVAGGRGPGKGDNQLNYPQRTTVAFNGDYVIADGTNNRIQRCPAGGTGDCTTVAGGAKQVGNDRSPDRVRGNGAAELAHPNGVEITNNGLGDYLIADSSNSRIQLCPAAGGDCLTVAGEDQLSYPGDVKVASNGDYVIADRGSHRVLQCPAAGGDCTTLFGVKGEIGDDSFHLSMPWSISISDWSS